MSVFSWILLNLFVDTAVDRKVYSNTPHIIKSKWRIEVSRFHISHVEYRQSTDRETVLRVRNWTDGGYLVSADSADVQHESSTQPPNRVNHVAATVDGRTVPAEVFVVLHVKGC